jgi:hypothetical protein
VAVIVTAASIVAVLPVRSSAQTAGADNRRKHIRYMEGVLVQAVRMGAETFGSKLEQYEPTGVTMLSGSPRVRGFLLDGHGIFFDVEVPDINQSVVWSVMTTQRDRQATDAIESLRSAMRGLPQGPLEQAQAALQYLSNAVGPLPSRAQSTGSTLQTLPPPPGQVSAAKLPPMDPRKEYQDAVVDALVDAMLGYSVQMSLGPDEWLTVAARGSDVPLTPAQGLADAVTITVRVKGSDLATYHGDATRRAEIREKVKADAKVF